MWRGIRKTLGTAVAKKLALEVDDVRAMMRHLGCQPAGRAGPGASAGWVVPAPDAPVPNQYSLSSRFRLASRGSQASTPGGRTVGYVPPAKGGELCNDADR